MIHTLRKDRDFFLRTLVIGIGLDKSHTFELSSSLTYIYARYPTIRNIHLTLHTLDLIILRITFFITSLKNCCIRIFFVRIIW